MKNSNMPEKPKPIKPPILIIRERSGIVEKRATDKRDKTDYKLLYETEIKNKKRDSLIMVGRIGSVIGCALGIIYLLIR